jgi:hypothetical protein
LDFETSYCPNLCPKELLRKLNIRIVSSTFSSILGYKGDVPLYVEKREAGGAD